MAAAVATAAREAVLDDCRIDAMTSSSRHGQHQHHAPVFAVAADRCGRAGRAGRDLKTLRQLPPGIQPPSYNKSNPADSPILYLALTSTTMPLSALDEYAETFLAQRLSTVDGGRAGAGVRIGEVRGAHSGRSEGATRRAASGWTK